MHGGSVTLARRYLENFETVDLILTTDMLDLTTFLALTRAKTCATPTVLYMHENQLTYPLPDDPSAGSMRRQRSERDLHYAFVNYTSMMAADRVVFNSQYHREDVMAALPRYLKHFPEDRELMTVEEIAGKAAVMSVGVHFEKLQSGGVIAESRDTPLVIWNQRWEYDKNPAQFFQVLFDIEAEGLPFRLALCGEMFERWPRAFSLAVRKLKKQLIHLGYADEERYHGLLREAEITISTASHEFFGVSIVEAIACKTFPILPKALSYPEIVPVEFHQACLYLTYEELLARLRWALGNRLEAKEIAAALSAKLSRFDWSHIASEYDDFFQELSNIKLRK
jgi:glycosyltransferase involved in cell wall biosynthesis